MGMRIQVGLGYALDLFKHELDTDIFNSQHESDGVWRDLGFQIIQEVQNSKPKKEEQELRRDSMFTDRIHFSQKRLEDGDSFDLNELVDFQEEFFREDVAVFKPFPFGNRWKRRDDDIDYHQAGFLRDRIGEPTETILKRSIQGIYPYLGLMRLNEEWNYGVENFVEPFYVDRWEKGDLQEEPIPYIPLQILIMIKHMFGLSEEKALECFMTMRPCYYRYWS